MNNLFQKPYLLIIKTRPIVNKRDTKIHTANIRIDGGAPSY
jgi:hypothetical protein